ncbi:MAG TPA: AAA family ATPase [Thermoplasmata archaeon]|nr:AAA family ATPase [Thermoplasmata archaeon]HUI38499.1 AAA family ATPase [Thermoplasmata archaeon]
MPVVSYLPAEILDYVETHAPTEDGGFGISQRELAKALGYHPCSMSRPLADLVGQGLLATRRGLVRGGLRKQLVYSLTDEGRQQLLKQTQDVPLLSGAIPPPPNPFFGRRAELDELWSVSQEGGVVFVEGPPGMGKSSLVSRHLRRLKAGRIPFWFTVRAGTAPRHFASSLARALAPLGAQQLAYYSQLPRQPLGREVADLVLRALGDRAMVAVIDDMHAAGPDARKFLEDLIRGLNRERSDILFLLIGQEPPAFSVDPVRSSHLVLGGLDRTAAHALTDRQGGLADRFEAVFQSSLGSPLLLQLAVGAPDVAATVRELPAAIVERFSRPELVGLLPLAFANEGLPGSVFLETSGLPAARVDQFLRSGVLQGSLDTRLELLQVVRTALLGKVVPSEERAAHLKLAQYYGRSRRPEAVRERFCHLVAGEAWKLAVQVLLGQERTLLSLGYSDSVRGALRHLTVALPRGAARVRAHRVEAAILRAHSDYAEAIQSLRRSITDAEGDDRTQAESLMLIVELHVRQRQIEEARQTLAEARGKGLDTRRLQLLSLLSDARITELEGNLPLAQVRFQQAFEIAKRARIADLALEGVAAWSRLASLGGDREAALKVVAEGLQDARASGRLDIVFNLLLVRARAYAENGQKELAETEMRMLRVEAESLGYLSQLTYTLSGLSAMAAEGERWSEAVAYARQASSLAERLGNDTVLGHTLAVLCAGEHRQGALQEARIHGERAIAVLSRLPPSDSLMLARAYLTEVYVSLNLKERAREEYHAAMELADRMGMSWWKDRIKAEMADKLSDSTAA